MAAAGRIDDVAKFLAGLPNVAKSNMTEGPIFRDVGIPLSEAIVACVNQEYGRAVDLLVPVLVNQALLAYIGQIDFLIRIVF